MVIILTEVLIQVKGEGRPNTRWGKLKRWLPEWKDRWEKIEERGSLIYMIVEIATGKVDCGETAQSYSGRWHDHVCAVGRYQRIIMLGQIKCINGWQGEECRDTCFCRGGR